MSIRASVIIPVFHAEKTIDKCVESLIYGKEQNIEIILIEDCSGDKSWEHCLRLKEKFSNVCCIQNKQHKGIAYSRNCGMKTAKGKYILFVDSDDWVSYSFVSSLIAAAEKDTSRMIMCGYKFVDIRNRAKQYTMINSERTEEVVGQSEYIQLKEKNLIQKLWNKIFKLDIIQEKNIVFDENLRLGEDFQFVLTYMKEAGVESFKVINEPLYYYIHENNLAFRKQFDSTGFEQELINLDRFLELSGYGNPEDKLYHEFREKEIQRLLYLFLQNSSIKTREKLKTVQQSLGKKQIGSFYWKYRVQRWKEQIYKAEREVENAVRELGRSLRKYRQEKRIKALQTKIDVSDCTLISQNCIAGVFYHDMNSSFLSPTINLFFDADSFFRFTERIEYYLSQELKIRWGEEYPIGALDDVTLYFMHYNSCSEALESWNRRVKRVNFKKIIVLSTDRDGFDQSHYEKWCRIQYPKLLFTVHPEYTQASVIFSEFVSQGCIPDTVTTRKLFYKDNKLVELVRLVHEARSES